MSRYLFDENDLYKKVIILLSIINASKENHYLLNSYEQNREITTIFYYEWAIIQDSLINLAIQFRLIDDLFSREKKTYKLPYPSVGYMATNETRVDLSFRESCNKIVHAEKFEPVFDGEHLNYSNQIILEGKKGNTSWKVNINIQEFCISALALIQQYEDDWDISSRTRG